MTRTPHRPWTIAESGLRFGLLQCARVLVGALGVDDCEVGQFAVGYAGFDQSEAFARQLLPQRAQLLFDRERVRLVESDGCRPNEARAPSLLSRNVIGSVIWISVRPRCAPGVNRNVATARTASSSQPPARPRTTTESTTSPCADDELDDDVPFGVQRERCGRVDERALQVGERRPRVGHLRRQASARRLRYDRVGRLCAASGRAQRQGE